MKKTAAILFLFVYLMFASGLRMSLHYCGGKLASVAFGYAKTQEACCAKKIQKSKCCHDQSLVLKIGDQHVKVVETATGQRLFQAITTFKYSTFPITFDYIFGSDAFTHHPPDLRQPPLFLLNRVFRI